MAQSDDTREDRLKQEQDQAEREPVVDEAMRGESPGGDDLDLGAETGTDVVEGAGGATAGDATPVDVTTAEELDRAHADAGDLGTDGLDLDLDLDLEGELERDLGSNAGDYSSAPTEIGGRPGGDLDGGLEGAASADNSDYPNLQKNLEEYKRQALEAAKEGDFKGANDAANAATTDINQVNETGVDVPLVGESSGGWGYEVRVDADDGVVQPKDHEVGDNPYQPGTSAYQQLNQVEQEQNQLFAPKPPGRDQPIDQHQDLRPGMTDPSEGWGDDPNDPFDHDIGYTDPVDDVDSTLGGISPTDAPTDTVANYEEGYLPPDDLTGDEIPADGHLDPLINFE